jgi:hypothetical protein
MAEDLDAVYKLTYEEAKQALSNQAGALGALRSRAGTLLQVGCDTCRLLYPYLK